MASLRSLALNSRLFIASDKMEGGGEEKKYDDDSTTVASLEPPPPTTTTTLDTTTTVVTESLEDHEQPKASKPIANHVLLQQRMNKHGKGLKRRFSTSNLLEMNKTTTTTTQTTVATTTTTQTLADEVIKAETEEHTAVLVAGESQGIQSEPDTPAAERKLSRQRFLTPQKRERVQKLSHLRSRSASKQRSTEPLAEFQESASMAPSFATPPRTGSVGTTPSRSRSRSRSIPKQRIQRFHELRSRSAIRSNPDVPTPPKVIANTNSNESAKEGSPQLIKLRVMEAQVPKFLKKKVERMRRIDSFHRRAASGVEADTETENAEIASIEEPLYHTDQSELLDKKATAEGERKIAKTESKLARRNRIKQNSPFRYLPRPPSPLEYKQTLAHALNADSRSLADVNLPLDTSASLVAETEKARGREPPAVTQPQVGSHSVSPLRHRKDPLGARSPPLPRHRRVAASLSPIPRRRPIEPIKTDEGLSRDPPARLLVPDVSGRSDTPRDPDAKTPRGSSPRNAFAFAMEEVNRRTSDGNADKNLTPDSPSGMFGSTFLAPRMEPADSCLGGSNTMNEGLTENNRDENLPIQRSQMKSLAKRDPNGNESVDQFTPFPDKPLTLPTLALGEREVENEYFETKLLEPEAESVRHASTLECLTVVPLSDLTSIGESAPTVKLDEAIKGTPKTKATSIVACESDAKPELLSKEPTVDETHDGESQTFPLVTRSSSSDDIFEGVTAQILKDVPSSAVSTSSDDVFRGVDGDNTTESLEVDLFVSQVSNSSEETTEQSQSKASTKDDDTYSRQVHEGMQKTISATDSNDPLDELSTLAVPNNNVAQSCDEDDDDDDSIDRLRECPTEKIHNMDYTRDQCQIRLSSSDASYCFDSPRAIEEIRSPPGLSGRSAPTFFQRADSTECEISNDIPELSSDPQDLVQPCKSNDSVKSRRAKSLPFSESHRECDYISLDSLQIELGPAIVEGKPEDSAMFSPSVVPSRQKESEVHYTCLEEDTSLLNGSKETLKHLSEHSRLITLEETKESLVSTNAVQGDKEDLSTAMASVSLASPKDDNRNQMLSRPDEDRPTESSVPSHTSDSFRARNVLSSVAADLVPIATTKAEFIPESVTEEQKFFDPISLDKQDSVEESVPRVISDSQDYRAAQLVGPEEINLPGSGETDLSSKNYRKDQGLEDQCRLDDFQLKKSNPSLACSDAEALQKIGVDSFVPVESDVTVDLDMKEQASVHNLNDINSSNGVESSVSADENQENSPKKSGGDEPIDSSMSVREIMNDEKTFSYQESPIGAMSNKMQSTMVAIRTSTYIPMHAEIHVASKTENENRIEHGSISNELVSTRVENQALSHLHQISQVDLEMLRGAAASSSIFDNLSSVGNPESIFTVGTAITVRRTESKEFKDAVESYFVLGPLEEDAERLLRGKPSQANSVDRFLNLELSEVPDPELALMSVQADQPCPVFQTRISQEVTGTSPMTQLALDPPPPPPPGGKKRPKKKKRSSSKKKLVLPIFAPDQIDTVHGPALDVSSGDSADEDLANFLDSLDGRESNRSEAATRTEGPGFANHTLADEHPSVVEKRSNVDQPSDGKQMPLVEEVGSFVSVDKKKSRLSLDLQLNGNALMIPIEDISHDVSTQSLRAGTSETETLFGPVEPVNITGRNCVKTISPISSAKVLQGDKRLAEKVDTAVSLAAECLELQVPDNRVQKDPGTYVDVPVGMLTSSPVKLERTRASGAPGEEHKDFSQAHNLPLKRFLKPEGRPSPFEAIVFLKPVAISQILDFLGDPSEICRMKSLNRTCFYYIEENQHKLIQRAVRLGGMSMGMRPAFWMWVVLSATEQNRPNHSESLAPISETTTDFTDTLDEKDLVRLQQLGRAGKWNLIIERDVSRSFGNLPPHKTGARLRTDSIVRALVSWGRNRTLKSGVRGTGPAPSAPHRSGSTESDDVSLTPTDTVSEWGGVSPSGSFGAMSFSSSKSEQYNRLQSLKDRRRRRADDELALSGNILTDETKSVLQKKLSFILHALSAAHPEIGYCQGMDYVVAHLLRLLQDTVRWHAVRGTLPPIIRSGRDLAPQPDMSQAELSEFLSHIDQSLVLEETCFRMMDTLLTDYSLGHFYWPELRCLKTCCRVFEKLIQVKLPVLADHFEHHELNVGLFALGWFQTLFLYLPSMPTATVCHMWDIWLVERSFKIFFRVATAILFLSQPILLNHELEGMMSYLNTFPDATLLSPDILIACALQIKVTNRMLMDLEQKVVDES